MSKETNLFQELRGQRGKISRVDAGAALVRWCGKIKFLEMLDAAREKAGIPFRVNSGYRTPEHNAAVGGVPDSAHTRGWAADIAAGTLEQKIRIVRAARAVGFNRFGIYDTFIHLDCDPGKRGDVAWNGKGYAVEKGWSFSGFPFDPFTA